MAIKLNAATGGGSVALDAPNSTDSNANVVLTLPTNDGDSGQYLQTNGSGTLSWQTVLSNAEDGTGTDFEFNSGFGSNATAYGVRAWINFDGSAATIGTGRGSGNMDAVTDNGTGDYTVNFTNDMPDANYAVLTGVHDYTTFGVYETVDPTVGAVRFQSRNPGNASGLERDYYAVAIVR